MSPIRCAHTVKGYYANYPFTSMEPTREEIRSNRLYRCPDCGKWFSLVNKVKVVKGAHLE